MRRGDGSNPQAGLVEGTDGALNGTTYKGGTNATDPGTVFKISQDGSAYSVIHYFTVGGGFAETPEFTQASLCRASDGLLYGTSYSGGYAGGAVFALNPSGDGFAMLHPFNLFGDPGVNPKSRLVEGTNGALYGTTWTGPAAGTIFRLDGGGGNFTTVHQFAYGTEGGNPLAGLLAGSDGFLYGIASGGVGGGTVFKMSYDGSAFSVLHIFAGGSGGSSPEGDLIEGSDGFLYGTTAGIAGTNWGTVFKLSKDGTEFSTLHVFTGESGDGIAPKAGLIQASDGNLYGTTDAGGAHGAGTIFVLALSVRPGAPTIHLGRAVGAVVFSWPSSATNYSLETSPALGVGANWTSVGGAVLSGDNFVLTNDLTGNAAFFRLRQQ